MKLPADLGRALAEDAATLALLQDHELSEEVLSELKRIGFPDNLAQLPNNDASQKVFHVMRETIAGLPASFDQTMLDELAADFAAIFLTGAHGASPYESYWLSEDHLLCQEAMFDIREIYGEQGLSVANWHQRPDDHLVYQLQFIAHLLEIAATDSDWRSLADFLDYHLLRWLPDFADRVALRSYTPFYAALALMTDAWCQQLRHLIEQHLGEARPNKTQIEEKLSSKRLAETPEVPIRFMPGMAGPSW